MRVLLPFLLLSLAACNRQPQWYPPPEQRHPEALPDPPPASSMVNMSDPDAPDHFVRDIGGLEASSWRWTQKRPTVKIPIPAAKALKYVIDFAIWDGTVKNHGPVTMSFFVGDKLLDKVLYRTPGVEHFEKPVDPAWIENLTETEISAEIDKVHVSSDGGKLGFILTRMGFEAIKEQHALSSQKSQRARIDPIPAPITSPQVGHPLACPHPAKLRYNRPATESCSREETIASPDR